MIHVDPAHVASDPLPAAAPAEATAPALIEAQLAMLMRLAEIGMEIAEATGREAVRAADAGEGADRPLAQRRDPGLAFARVARAVRMTIALQSRLLKDLADLDRVDEMAERSRTTKRRMRLARVVDEAVREGVDARRAAGQLLNEDELDEDDLEEEIERLTDEAVERLIDAEDDELSGRAFGDVVAAICRELGLSPDWGPRLLAATAAPPDASGEAPEDADAPGAAPPEPSAARPPDPEPPPPGRALAGATAAPPGPS